MTAFINLLILEVVKNNTFLRLYLKLQGMAESNLYLFSIYCMQIFIYIQFNPIFN